MVVKDKYHHLIIVQMEKLQNIDMAFKEKYLNQICCFLCHILI